MTNQHDLVARLREGAEAMTDEQVERVARAIYETASGPWEFASDYGQDIVRHEARAAIAAIAALQPQDEQIERVLADPVAVHLNMLRGGIAKPSITNIIHLYGADALRAALPPQGDGWQDIATAPRDGTEIDIWIGNSPIVDDGYRIVSCWWSAVDGYWFGPMGGPARDLRHEAGVPTHWMPLPTPPAETPTGQR